MSILGLSFGAKKNKTDQTNNVNKNEVTSQTQTGTTTSSGTTNTTSAQQAQSASQTAQSASQVGSSNTTGSQTGVTTGKVSSFSDPVLSGIESLVTEMFGSVNAKPTISDFDVASFVDSGTAKAHADIGSRVESEVNQLVNNIGGTQGSNSMVALLGSKLKNAGAAEEAGIKSQLTAQGEGIKRENTLAENALAQTSQGFLGNLLAALKGGVTTSTGTEAVQNTQNTQTAQQSNTVGSEATQSSQTAQSTQTQQLLEQIAQALNGTTTTVGTEHVKGTTSEKGGGFSLAL